MRFIRIVAVVVFVACGSLAWGQRENFPPAPATKPPPPASELPAAKAPPAGPALSAGSTGSYAAPYPTPWNMYPAPGTASPETPANVAQRASCVVQIDGGGVDLPPTAYGPYGHSMAYEVGRGGCFDAAMAATLVSSTALSDPVVQTSLKQKPGLVGRQVLIVATPCGNGNRFVRLEVSLKKAEKPWPNDAANTFLAALVDRLRTAAEQSQKAENAVYAARLAVVTAQLAAAKARSSEIGASVRSVREALERTGEFYNEPANALRNLRLQKRQVEMALDPLKARLAALEDEFVPAFEGKVRLAENILSTLQAAKSADAQLVAAAKTALAEATEKLATARAMAPSSSEARIFAPKSLASGPASPSRSRV